MEERNELNDIILNKSAKSNSTKKILLTIATFAITLIIVVVIMNQVSGKKESALPHAPQMSEVTVEEVVQEPEVEVTEESSPADETSSELIEDVLVEEATAPAALPTAKSSEPAFDEPEIIEEPDYAAASKQKSTTAPETAKTEEKQVLKPKPVRPSGKYDPKSKRVADVKPATVAETGQYYIQVGSFATYAPSKPFLDKISNHGYTYTFHKITRNGRTLNKVLVGPFKTQSAAREALPVIKSDVEAGAFLTKI